METPEMGELKPQAFVRGTEGHQARNQLTFLPTEVGKDVPPSLRQWTRWEYLSEYAEWWRQGVTSKVQAVCFFGLGLLTLETFPPGGLLMIALAARHQDLAHIYDFIVKKFGKSRTLILVD